MSRIASREIVMPPAYHQWQPDGYMVTDHNITCSVHVYKYPRDRCYCPPALEPRNWSLCPRAPGGASLCQTRRSLLPGVGSACSLAHRSQSVAEQGRNWRRCAPRSCPDAPRSEHTHAFLRDGPSSQFAPRMQSRIRAASLSACKISVVAARTCQRAHQNG